MNKIFKVIWSKSKQCYIVVSEIAKNKTGKKKIVVASILAALAMQSGMITDVMAADPPSSKLADAAVAVGTNGVAIGSSAKSQSNQSVAIGYFSNAQAPSASPENPATAVGAGANANGAGTVALGLSANATGANAIALGGGSNGGTNKTEATGKYAAAIGFNAKASQENAVALGPSATAAALNSIALGKGASITAPTTGTTLGGQDSIAMGTGASAKQHSSVSVGLGASSDGVRSVAIGPKASATDEDTIAIGTGGVGADKNNQVYGANGGGASTSVNGVSGVNLYYGAKSSGKQSIAIGYTANAKESGIAFGNYAVSDGGGGTAMGKSVLSRNGGIVVGQSSNAIGKNSVAYGNTVKANGENSTAMGYSATADGQNAVAVGYSNTASNKDSVAIGNTNQSTNQGSVTVGYGNNATNDNAVAIGRSTNASGLLSTAIGNGATSQGTYDVAIGSDVTANGNNSVAIGRNAKTSNTSSLAIGVYGTKGTSATGDYSIAMGRDVTASAESAIAIGKDAVSNKKNAVAIGSGSDTSSAATAQSSTTIAGKSYSWTKGVLSGADLAGMQVSVGKSGSERQIKNVAAGEISANSTDAINGSQLYAVASGLAQDLKVPYVSINSTATGTGSNVDNDGAQGGNSIAIGPSTTATRINGVAIGNGAQSLSEDSIVIGRNAKAETKAGAGLTTTSRAIAIGSNSRVAADVTQGVAIGSGNSPDEGAVVTGDQSIAIGGNVKVDGHAAIAIGGDDARKAAAQTVSYTSTNDVEVTGSLQTAIQNLTGYNLSKYQGTTAGHAGVAYGTSALAGNAGVAIGTASDSMTRKDDKGNTISNKPVTNAVAIGTGARANFDNSVAIGGGSNTDHYATKQVNAVIDGVEVKWSGGENISPGDVVSFGAKGFERQLKNVAPGEVSQTSTDAVNGSQIYSLARKVTNIMNGGSGSVVNVNALGEPLSKVSTIENGTKVEKYYRTVDVKDDGTLVSNAVAQTPASLSLVNVTQTDVNKQTQTPRILGNVANGVKDNDAVNVSQLNAAKVKYFSVKSSDAGNVNNDGATGTDAIAIGPSATSNDVGSVALGKDAKANGAFTVALGGGNWQFKGAQANGVGTTALGSNTKTKANTNFQTAIGFGASTDADSALALGYNASAAAQNAIALGKSASTAGQDSLALGVNSQANGGSALAMGPGAQANSNYVVSLGYQANNGATNNANGVSIGWAAGMQSNGSSNVGIGSGAGRQISGNNNVSIGNGAGNIASSNLYTSDSIMLGTEARAINGTASKAVSSVIAIGKKASGGADSAIALGQGASSTNQNSIAIGTNSQATAYNGIAIGAYSVANTAGGVAGFNPNTSRTDTYSGLTGGALTSTTGAVAIGSDSQSRQLTGLAAGTQDTDAVNVAQLKSVNLAFKGNAGTGDVNLAAHPLTIQGNDNYITTSANGNTINISGKVQNITVTNGTATAANKGMADAQNVADAINNAVQSNAYKWKLTANGEATSETIAKDDTVDFSGDTNISVARNGKKITTSLKKDITVDSVKANKSITTGSGSNQITLDGTSGAVTGRTFSGNSFAAGNNVLSNTTLQIGSPTGANNVSITTDGLTAKAGTKTVKFGTNGIDAGGQQITNVSSGGNVGTNAANITDVQNAVSSVLLNLDTNSKTGSVNLKSDTLKITGANGIRTDLIGTGNRNLVIGLDQNTVKATTNGIGLSGDSGTMLRKFLKDGNADFKISGDGGLVTTSGTTTGVQVSVDKSKVKDLAVEAVTVSKANTVDNPITVTSTASINSKDYAIGIDTTKLAAKTNLAYTANGGTAKTVSLAKGLNFVNGANTVATVDSDGKVSFDLNTATKNQINTNTTDIAANKGKIATNTANIATNTANIAHTIALADDNGTSTTAKSLKDGNVSFNIKGDGKFISTAASGNDVTLTVNEQAIKDAAKSASSFKVKANAYAEEEVKGGDTITFNNGDNIEISQAGKTFTIKTAKNMTVDSLTAGNTVINTTGLTSGIGASAVSFGTNGVSAGNQVISNVASGGTTDTNAANIGDVKQAVANLSQNLNITDGTNNGTVDLKNQKLNVAGANGVTANVKNQTITVGLDANTVNATTKGIGLTGDTGSTGNKYLKDGDVSFTVTGDGNLVSTSATTAGVKVAVDAAKVKDLAVDAVTVSKDTQADNPITVTPTAGANSKDYAIGIDTTKLAAKTDLTYRANSAADANAKKVSLSKGLNFVDGGSTVATVDNDGKVSFDLNTATKNQINTNTTDIAANKGNITKNTAAIATNTAALARNISLGADAGTASSQSLSAADVAFNVKGATGDFVSTNMNGNTVEISTKRATINSNATTGEASVTGNDGLATAKNVADAINKAADAAKAGAAWNITTNSSTTDKTAVKGGDTVDLVNGDNIEITQDGTDKKKITVATKKDITVDSVTANNKVTVGSGANKITLDGTDGSVTGKAFTGTTFTGTSFTGTSFTAGNTVINTNGLTNGTTAITGTGVTTDNVTVGGISIDKTDGINAGNKVISNVASGGTTLTNAANIGDVQNAVANLSQNLNITDGTNNGTVDLKNQKLNVAGANGVTAKVNNQTITVGLDADTVNATTKGIGLTADTGSTGNKYLKDGDVSFAVTGDGSLVSTSATAAGVKVAVNSATITAGTDGTITAPTTDGVATAKNVANAINAAKKASKTEITANTGEAANATTGNVTLTSTTAADGHTIYDVKLNDKVTLGTGANAVTIDGTTGAITGKTATIGGVTVNGTANTIGGLSNTTWNGTAVSGRAATEDQLKAATGATALKFTGDVAANTGSINLKDDTFGIKGDGKYISTDVNGKNVKLTVSEAEVKKSAVAAVTVSTDTTDANNPLTVTPTASADGTTKDYKVTIDGTKIANKTNLSYKANNGTAKQVSLADGLDFTNGTLTTASIDDNGVVKYDVNTASITAGTDGTITGPTTDGVATAKNVAEAINAAKKASKTEVTANTGEAANATKGNVTLTSTTAADGHTIYDVKLNDKVTLGSGANAVTIDGTTGAITGKTATIGGVTINGTANTIGGLSNTTWNGTATTGRAATEDQLKAVADAAGSQTWNITADKAGTTGNQTGTKKNATVGKDETVELVAGDNLTINQNERKFTYSLNKDLANLTSVSVGTGTTETIKLDGATGKITAKNATIGGVTIDGDNKHVTGLSNTTWNGTATTGRAATEDQLKAVADTAKTTTDAVNLKFSGDTITSPGVVNLKDDTLGIIGDGKYVSTDANGKNLTVKVSEAEVKKSAVAAVTVSTDTTDANNPLTVTPTTSADGTTKDYKVTIDGTKIANKTNLSYKANDGTAKQVSLADGLNFKNGTLTTASIDDNGVVKYDVNTASITAGADGTITGPTTDGVATAQNVADAINAAKKASKTEITANTGEAANATTGNVTLTSTTAADGHTIYDVKLNDKVTLGTGANAVTIDGTAGKATIGSSIIDGVNNTFTTGGASPVTLNGATGTITGKTATIGGVTVNGTANTIGGLSNTTWNGTATTGRAATEDQLKAVADAAGSQTWEITADKKAGTSGVQTGTKENAKVGKNDTVSLIAGENLTVDQVGKNFTYSLNTDLVKMNSATFLGTGTNTTVITGDSITQTAGTQTNTSTAAGNTVADGTKSTETTAAGQVIKDGTKSNKSTVDNNVIDDGTGNVNTSNATSNTITDGTNTSTITAGKAQIGTVGIDGVASKITTGGTNAVVVNGADGTVKTGNVTVTGGTTNDITGLSNTTLSATDFATKGRAATEEQLKAATGATTLKFTGDVATNTGSVNLKDDTFGIKGDGKYISTDVNGKNVNLTVSEAEVKKSAVAAVTVSTDTTDANNPLTVTPTTSADGTTKDYKVTIDGTKIANKTNLSYKANDGTAKQVSLADGLNFKNGTLTTASIDNNGVVKYDVNTASITAGTDGTITGPTTDGVATAQNVADAINAAKKASKTEITANTGEAANATTGNVSLTSTTAADGHTIYDVKLNDKVTLGTGANAVTIDGTAGKATIGSSIIDGVNNTFTTGGASPVTLNGATGTITGKTANIGGVTVNGTANTIGGLSNTTWNGTATTGRAATEDQLKAVADAAGSQTWEITADKKAGTSGAQTGTKENAKVGKDDKVSLIAGENLTVDQAGKNFTYSLNTDLVKMNSATFLGTGTNTTVITGDSITQTAGTQTNTSTAGGNTVADGTKSTETTAAGQVIKDGAKSNKSTVDNNVIDDGTGNVNTSNATSNTITDGTNTSTITAGKATIGSSVVDGVNNTFTTGGASPVTLNGATGTITGKTANIGGVTVDGTNNHVMGLANKDWTPGVTQAVSGRAATEDQLQKVSDAVGAGWKVNTGKVTGSTGESNGATPTKVASGEEVQFQAGNNLIVDQNGKTVAYSLNKALKDLESATFNGTGTNKTVITGDSITQTAGTQTNTSTAAGNTVADGIKSTKTTADGQVIKDGTKSNKSTVDSNVIDDGTGNVNTSNATSNTITDGTNTSTITAGKATIGSSIVDGVNNTFTTGGTNAVKLDGAAGTIKTGTVTVTGGTTNDITGLSNTTVNSADFATKGRAATEEQLKAVGEQTWQITADKKTGTSGAQTGLKENAKVGKDDKVSLIAGENLTVDQAGKNFTYSLNTDLVKMNSATFEATGGKTTVIKGDSIVQTDGTKTNTATAAGNTVANGTKSTETTADGQVIKDGTKSNKSTVDNNVIDDGTGNVNTSNATSNTITDGTNTSTITAGKATIGSSIVDGVNNTFTTGGASPVTLNGATGTITGKTANIGGVTVDGTNNHVMGLANKDWTPGVTQAVSGRAATEDQLQKVSDAVGAGWKVNTGKVTGSTGESNGAASTKVSSGEEVQFQAGNNLIVDQNGKTVAYSLNKALKDLESATFNGTGTNKTVINGDSITQTAGTQTNTSTAGGNTVADGTKSTETTAAGQVIKDGTKTNTSTVDENTIVDGTKSNKSTVDGNTITDGTNTTETTSSAVTVKDNAGNSTVITKDNVTTGVGGNKITLDGTAGKATIGSSVVDGVNNTFTTGGTNAVTMDGAAGTIKTGTVTVIGGTTNDITGLSNTTVNSADFATKGRAATEEQLKAVGEQTWQITADKDTATSGAQTGIKKDAKVGKDNKVQLIAGENMTINQNERDFTFTLNKDLVKMNSATFLGTGSNTTVITGDSITQTAGTQTNTSTAAGNTVADGTKSTETTAAGQVIKDGAKSNKSTVDSNVIDDGNGNKNTSNATSNTITDGTNTSTITAGKANIGNIAVDGVNNKITMGTGATPVTLDGANGHLDGLTNTTWVPGVTKATTGRAATEDQLQQVSDAVGAGWKVNTGTVAGSSGVSNGATSTKVSSGEEVKLQAGDNLVIDQNGKTVSYSLNKDLSKMNSATFEATGGKTTVIKGDSIVQTDGGKTNTSTAAGNTVADGTKSTATTAAGTTITDGAKTNTSTADKNVINDGVGNTNTSTATSNTLKNAAGDETKADAKGVTVKDAAGNNATFTKDGITITKTGKDTVSLTTNGLDNGKNKIVNVAAGVANTDAVNVGQLKEYAAKSTTELTANNGETAGSTTGNIVLTKTTAADGHTIYDNKLNDKITLGAADPTKAITVDGTAGTIAVADKITLNGKDGKAGIGTVGIDGKDGIITTGGTNSVKVDGSTGTVTGLTNKTWTPSSIVSGRAATEDQLKSAVADSGWKVTVDSVDSGKSTVVGTSPEKIKAEETVTFKAGNNMMVTQTGKSISYAVNPELTDMKSATFKDAAGNTTVTNGNGITITPGSANPTNPHAGPVSLTKDGLNNGNNQIKGVAPGTDPTDAVNVAQLNASNANTSQAINQVAGEVQHVGAHAAAMAALKPIQYDPLEPTQVMAGVGNYRGETAAALGLAHYTNENTMFNVGVSVGGNHNMVNAGVTHKFGYSSEKKNIPDRYKAGPISSVYVMQDEVSSLKKENAEQKYVIADQAARLTTLEAENEQQRRELAETKKGLDDLKAAVDKLLASKG
ncbi:YadA-like family protein [Veillonella sp.]